MKILFIDGTGILSSAEVTPADGVRRSLAWFEAHPEFQTIDYERNSVWDRVITSNARAFL